MRRRVQVGAPPAVNPTYESDAVAARTDRIFKMCVGAAGFLRLDLALIAALAGTDKFGVHDYVPTYDILMRPFRSRRISLLELGVGGYSAATGGESLRMWAAYFRRGRIYGVDIYDKTALSGGRVKVFQCSQTDRERLTVIAKECGPFDFIIDDGSHDNADQIYSFGVLWPFLTDGGSYVVEDVQTSYWPSFGGGSVGSDGYKASALTFFKDLVDSVNVCEFLDRSTTGPTLEPTIGRIEFRHNLIVITKDRSIPESNLNLEDASIRAWLLSSKDTGGPPVDTR
ncbi:MAG TPA: class I SAM-dependent methyltransferase [Methylomirabilota bacterium]|nr:class I SAM-dependent methyltransferase [Methylomirabilota bacterium]